MSARMVLVSAELVEHVRWVFNTMNLGPNVVDALTATLSQPTPTAEPVRAEQSNDGDRLIEFAEQILGVPLDPWQMRLCRRVFGGNVGHSTGRPDAAPPSIADMVPGTTFIGRFRAPDDISHEYRFTVMDDLWVRADNGQWSVAIAIDPSTIRDVTPPAAP